MEQHCIFSIFILLFINSCTPKQETHWDISSPNGNVKAVLRISEAGQLSYLLKNGEHTVIEPSPMGMEFEEATFNKGLAFTAKEQAMGKTDSYTLASGKQRVNNPEWNEMTLHFKNPEGKTIKVCLRLFDDGLAFNYKFDGNGSKTYKLTRELTGFKVPGNSDAWMAPYDTIAPWAPAYETFYKNKIKAGTQSPGNKNGWALPMLFNSDGHWTLIADANIPEGHAGMYVDGNPENCLYQLMLPKEEEAKGVCPSQPVLALPFETAWRVVITGDNPGVMAETNIITHLADANKLKEDAWIEPGKSSWSWWSENDSPKDYKRLKDYVDFSAKMGWKYTLVDANWNVMEGGTLQQLAEYAKSKDVGILAWYNSGGPHNEITEQPRNRMHERATRRAEFRKIQDWGIQGIKVDFFQSDKPCILQLYHDILRDAADFQLLINVHGSTLPRGWRRTYPNLMTMESVRGAEAYRFDPDYPEYGAAHNTILPFTRNAVGPMDYTPVAFSDAKYPHQTTYAHELALLVVFESGIQHLADSDKSYLAQPDYVLDYLKAVPVAWEDTRYVDGAPGTMAVLARKNGSKWFLSGINGLNTPERLESGLDFLEKGSYEISLIKDGQDASSFAYETLIFDTGSKFSVEMLPRGGFAAVIDKR